MDLKTGLSIFNKPWLIQPESAMQMLDYWDHIKPGNNNWKPILKGESETNGAPLSSYKIYKQLFENSSVIMSPDNIYDMRDFKGFDGASVAIIPVNGPLMKGDYWGYAGTNTLKRLTQMAGSTASVQTILFVHDSPGGTVDGTLAFADAVEKSPKRTISFVDGYMCSADYWIGCASDMIIASAETDLIGCIGTMCVMYDMSEYMKQMGVVRREYYATDSPDKNKDFNDALKGNGKAFVEQQLDPQNDIFLNYVRKMRGDKINKGENVLTGKTYNATKALTNGLIDGIQSFDDVLTMAMKGDKKKTNQFLTFNNTKMSEIKNVAELKAQYPELCQQIVDEEKDRAGAYLSFVDVDAKAVTEGIASGKNPSQTFMAEMARKQFAASTLKGMENENTTVATPEATITTPDPKNVNQTAEEKAATEKQSKDRVERYKQRNGIK